MSSNAPKTHRVVDPITLTEIGMQARDLENRALSLYLAAPDTIGELRAIFERARMTMMEHVPPREDYKCPAGMVPCNLGCCIVRSIPGE